MATTDTKATSLERSRGNLASAVPIEGIVIGRLVRGGPVGALLVEHPANPSEGPLEARSTIRTSPEDVEREVALGFEEGDPERPIILGFLHEPVTIAELGQATELGPVLVDDERVTISAKKEVVLRCGKASITLTRAGKVIIRGRYLLSRSSGVNRIKGGSVQIN